MRSGVGIIVLNSFNKVFVGKRKDNPSDKWQMPQGGVDKGESYINAMKRELSEETSIKNIKILKEIDRIYEYELPDNLVGKECQRKRYFRCSQIQTLLLHLPCHQPLQIKFHYKRNSIRHLQLTDEHALSMCQSTLLVQYVQILVLPLPYQRRRG